MRDLGRGVFYAGGAIAVLFLAGLVYLAWEGSVHIVHDGLGIVFDHESRLRNLIAFILGSIPYFSSLWKLYDIHGTPRTVRQELGHDTDRHWTLTVVLVAYLAFACLYEVNARAHGDPYLREDEYSDY